MDKSDILSKLLRENPKSGELWYLLGTEYDESGKSGEALRAFSEALKYCDDETKAKIIAHLSKLSLPQPVKPADDLQDAAVKAETDEESENNDVDDDEDEDEGSDDDENILKLRVVKGSKNIGGSDISENIPKVLFEDVGGLNQLKETIRMKIIKPFVNPSLFEKFRKKVGGGIMLFGPPGCGKTFMAKATAGECNASFIPVRITDILDPYFGASEKNIADIFATARLKKPCVLFFDELDTLGFNRAKLSSDLMRPVINQLLSEIEGIDTDTDRLLIIGATNMPWDVDPAFKRPGRFDKTIFVPPPDKVARETIFKLKLADRPVENIDCGLLAQETELYSGADIENVVEVATENVIAEIMRTGDERTIKMKDLRAAVFQTKPSTVEWLRTIKNYVKYSNQAGLYDDVEKYITAHKI